MYQVRLYDDRFLVYWRMGAFKYLLSGFKDGFIS